MNWSANATIPSWTARTGWPSACAISMPLRSTAVPKRLLGCRPKREPIAAARRPGQRTLERAEGQRRRRRRLGDWTSAGAAAPLQLARPAARSDRGAVDRRDQRRRGSATARSSAVRAVVACASSAASCFDRASSVALLLRQRLERALMLLDALAIDAGSAPRRCGRRGRATARRRRRAAGASSRRVPACRAAPAAPRLGPLGLGDQLQRVGPRAAHRRAGARSRRAGARSRQFLDLDLPFELELPQLDEQLALFGDERLGLALQLLDPLGGALGRRLRAPRRASGRRPSTDGRSSAGRSAARRSALSAVRRAGRSLNSGLPSMSRNRQAEELQHGRRDVHDRRRDCASTGTLAISTPAVVAKS